MYRFISNIDITIPYNMRIRERSRYPDDKGTTFLGNITDIPGYDEVFSMLFHQMKGPPQIVEEADRIMRELDDKDEVFGEELQVKIFGESPKGTVKCYPYVEEDDFRDEKRSTSVEGYSVDDAHLYFKSNKVFLAQVTDIRRDPHVVAYTGDGKQIHGFISPEFRDFESKVYDENIEHRLSPFDTVLLRIIGRDPVSETYFFQPALDITTYDEAIPGKQGFKRPSDAYSSTFMTDLDGLEVIVNIYAAFEDIKRSDSAVGFVRRDAPEGAGRLSRVVIEDGASSVGKIIPAVMIETDLLKTEKKGDIIFAYPYQLPEIIDREEESFQGDVTKVGYFDYCSERLVVVSFDEDGQGRVTSNQSFEELHILHEEDVSSKATELGLKNYFCGDPEMEIDEINFNLGPTMENSQMEELVRDAKARFL